MGTFTVIPLVGTCSTGGDLVVKSTRSVNGMLYGIHEDKGTLASGVDMTLAVIQSEMPKTLLTLTNADTDNNAFYPRASSCGATGSATTDSLIMVPIVGTLQLTIAEGGSAGIGGLYVYVVE